MKNSFAPIVITVYNRINHLKKCIESLKMDQLALESDIFIVSDAPNSPKHFEIITEIRNYISTIEGFKSVNLIAWEINKGSSRSFFDALKIILEKYDKFIFIEDDNVVSPYFLSYFQDAFEKYKNESSVFGICAYNYMIPIPKDYKYDAYFMRVAPMWGFGTWKSKFEDFLSKNQKPDFKSNEFKKYSRYLQQPSFYLKRMENYKEFWFDTVCAFYLYKYQMVNLLPIQSLVRNIGFDNSGEHCNFNESFVNQEILHNKINNFPFVIDINPNMEQIIIQFCSYSNIKKIKVTILDITNLIKKYLHKKY